MIFQLDRKKPRQMDPIKYRLSYPEHKTEQTIQE